ncbi:transporter substrate-binding domain-containing protein [Homoserinimonas sp. OAct 916]|uniref:transporter substrate-binding domain-containing protein n=1 Tax=Homoserinimonas sp. OAct 916 TaxID=2211450 RepID=UPI001300181C|nr:transporter substrate-binding domain-containing protein [Homoserinimonas sp. OAct 916]
MATIVAVMALGVTACTSTNESAEGEQAPVSSGLNLVNDGVLTVCISKNAYPPMYWNEGGELTGFDVESLRKIGEALDLEVKFSEMAFDGLLPALTSGRCDVLRSGMYINEERQEKADTIAYLQTGPALIVPSGNPLKISGVDDLAGVRIAVQAASANEKTLQRISEDLVARGLEGITLSSYPELPETVAALTNGRVDATIETDVAANEVAETLGEGYEVLGDLFEAETEFGMFLQKGSDLTETIRATASTLTEDGTFAAVAESFKLMPSRVIAP